LEFTFLVAIFIVFLFSKRQYLCRKLKIQTQLFRCNSPSYYWCISQ
jgi:hypothetical protein